MQKQILIAKLFGLDALDVALGKYELDKIQKEKLIQSLGLLAKGLPIDYIVGEVNILGLKLKVTPQSLIPREETEFWLQQFKQIVKAKNSCQLERSERSAEIVLILQRDNSLSIETIKDSNSNLKLIDIQNGDTEAASTKINSNLSKNKTLVDLGTGTGIIGLYLAEYYQKVLMLDIDPQTLSVAKDNIEINNKTNCQTLTSDTLLGLDLENLGGWDLVANLPYVPIGDLPYAKEYNVEFEPKLAIYSGEDGLDLFYKVLKQIKFIKNKPQVVLFELDPRNLSMAKAELEKLKYNCGIWHDQNGLERVLFGVVVAEFNYENFGPKTKCV
jgi:methylase of polypeptide subunit release factors